MMTVFKVVRPFVPEGINIHDYMVKYVRSCAPEVCYAISTKITRFDECCSELPNLALSAHLIW